MIVETAARPATASTVHARYEALLRLSSTLRAHRDTEELFRLLVAELRGVIDFDLLGCSHYDPAKGQWAFCLIESPGGRVPKETFGCEETPEGWVNEYQEPLVIPFTDEEPRFPRLMQLLRNEGIRSVCALPLRTAHHQMGCFAVGSQQPDAYSPAEVEFLSLVADGVAFAMDDAFHFETLQREKDRLKMLLDLSNTITSNLDLPQLLRAISGSIRAIMRSKGAAVALLDESTNQLRLTAIDFPQNDGHLAEGEIIPDDSPSVQSVRTGEPVVCELPGAHEHGKIICHVPLISRNRALGVLGVGRSYTFTPDDVAFLQQVAAQVSIAVENALAYGKIAQLTDKLSREKLYLEDEIRTELNFEEIVGKSSSLRAILQQVETVAPTDSTVLIYGETGTGKELIARAIHDLSSRSKSAFVKLNCAAIPTGLLESEMFGHERGAFTGAVAQRIGRFELASRGTVFLDEIGEIPLELQPKLLRVLQEREFERLGSSRTLKSDARLIAATNRNLADMVKDQHFRADLFYRLNVFPIQLPSLRERRDDIPLLVRHFVQQFARRMNRAIDTIPSETMSVLVSYHWPGNIRELQNLMERAVILSNGPILKVPLNDLQSQQPTTTPTSSGKFETLEDVERRHILETLHATDWIVAGPNGAAQRLGLKRSTLQVRMQKMGIRRARAAE
jgi:formate hydrogenlyase transcriptional activator